MDDACQGRNTVRQDIVATLRAADEPLSTAQICATLAQRLITSSSVHRHPATHERVYRQLISLSAAAPYSEHPNTAGTSAGHCQAANGRLCPSRSTPLVT